MAESFPIRDVLLDFTPYSPGLSIDEIQEMYNLGKVIKLASNENPLGTSPLVQKAICKKAGYAFRYTQSGNPRLLRALSKYLGVDEGEIVLGNGSDEVIDLLIRSCPTPGKHSVVAHRPAFSLYELQSKFVGVDYRTTPLNDDFSFNWEGLRALVDKNTALVFLTTPDNPSGYCPPVEEIKAFAKSLPSTCLLVIDEAYMDFSQDMALHSLFFEREEWPNLVILRTFSKSFGLAGLRLGFGIMPKHLTQLLCSVRPPFSVNILAEEAGIAALEDTAFRQQTMQTVAEGRKFLSVELPKLACKVYPSQSNFIMFKLPATCQKTVAEVFEALLSRGMIIRPLKSYGLLDYFRVTVGTMEENKMFINLLGEILA